MVPIKRSQRRKPKESADEPAPDSVNEVGVDDAAPTKSAKAATQTVKKQPSKVKEKVSESNDADVAPASNSKVTMRKMQNTSPTESSQELVAGAPDARKTRSAAAKESVTGVHVLPNSSLDSVNDGDADGNQTFIVSRSADIEPVKKPKVKAKGKAKGNSVDQAVAISGAEEAETLLKPPGAATKRGERTRLSPKEVPPATADLTPSQSPAEEVSKIRKGRSRNVAALRDDALDDEKNTQLPVLVPVEERQKRKKVTKGDEGLPITNKVETDTKPLARGKRGEKTKVDIEADTPLENGETVLGSTAFAGGRAGRALKMIDELAAVDNSNDMVPEPSVETSRGGRKAVHPTTVEDVRGKKPNQKVNSSKQLGEVDGGVAQQDDGITDASVVVVSKQESSVSKSGAASRKAKKGVDVQPALSVVEPLAKENGGAKDGERLRNRGGKGKAMLSKAAESPVAEASSDTSTMQLEAAGGQPENHQSGTIVSKLAQPSFEEMLSSGDTPVAEEVPKKGKKKQQSNSKVYAAVESNETVDDAGIRQTDNANIDLTSHVMGTGAKRIAEQEAFLEPATTASQEFAPPIKRAHVAKSKKNASVELDVGSNSHAQVSVDGESVAEPTMQPTSRKTRTDTSSSLHAEEARAADDVLAGKNVVKEMRAAKVKAVVSMAEGFDEVFLQPSSDLQSSAQPHIKAVALKGGRKARAEQEEHAASAMSVKNVSPEITAATRKSKVKSRKGKDPRQPSDTTVSVIGNTVEENGVDGSHKAKTGEDSHSITTHNNADTLEAKTDGNVSSSHMNQNVLTLAQGSDALTDVAGMPASTKQRKGSKAKTVTQDEPVTHVPSFEDVPLSAAAEYTTAAKVRGKAARKAKSSKQAEADESPSKKRKESRASDSHEYVVESASSADAGTTVPKQKDRKRLAANAVAAETAGKMSKNNQVSDEMDTSDELGPVEISRTDAEKVNKAAGNSLKRLGAHCSASNGLQNAVFEAAAMGCRSFALFIRNGRSWKMKELSDKDATLFKEACSAHGYTNDMIVPHGSYLLNAGAPDQEVLRKSREALLHEVQRCEKLGLSLYNFHPGSTCQKIEVSECIATIAQTVNGVLEQTKGVTILLETMAQQGGTVGGTFEELRDIIALVDDKTRIGVCLDTCHVFAAGRNIREKEEFERMMSEFNSVIGLQYLKALHLNDSMDICGSRHDRHANIGKGHIGEQGFRLLMNEKRLDGIPMILETPGGNYVNEMQLLYSYCTEDVL